MPGIVGFTINSAPKHNTIQQLKELQESINYLPEKYSTDSLFVDEYLAATAVYKRAFFDQCKPAVGNGIHVWIDGEIFYKSKLHDSFDHTTPDSEVLLALYQQHNDWKFLKKIDGIYNAVIYDKNSNNIHFITDRYGLGYLYLVKNGRQIAWASESKAFLKLDWFSPEIRKEGVSDFFEYGYHMGDKTWLKGVDLLSPATVLSYDLIRQEEIYNKYWHWDEIKSVNVDSISDEQEVIEELGRLFIKSVEERSKIPTKAKLGLTLSGGLDSRAILASMPKSKNPLYALTFGKKGAYDIKIAKQVAKLRNIKHEVYNLNRKNWFQPRIDGVWWTDGEMNLLHMHGIETLSETKCNKSLYSHNGYLGGAVGGGRYLDKGQSETFLIDNRGRRFIRHGPRILNIIHQTRLPFLDNDFLEFAMSIPPSLRRESYIYNKMLLLKFPKYFKEIPWSNTGLPVSKEVTRWNKLIKKIKKKFGASYSYHNYDKWLLEESVVSFIHDNLFNRGTLLYDFIERNEIKSEWKKIENKVGNPEKMCKYLTFEIYLKKLFYTQKFN